jgi:hypothetical protein
MSAVSAVRPRAPAGTPRDGLPELPPTRLEPRTPRTPTGLLLDVLSTLEASTPGAGFRRRCRHEPASAASIPFHATPAICFLFALAGPDVAAVDQTALRAIVWLPLVPPSAIRRRTWPRPGGIRRPRPDDRPPGRRRPALGQEIHRGHSPRANKGARLERPRPRAFDTSDAPRSVAPVGVVDDE